MFWSSSFVVVFGRLLSYVYNRSWRWFDIYLNNCNWMLNKYDIQWKWRLTGDDDLIKGTIFGVLMVLACIFLNVFNHVRVDCNDRVSVFESQLYFSYVEFKRKEKKRNWRDTFWDWISTVHNYVSLLAVHVWVFMNQRVNVAFYVVDANLENHVVYLCLIHFRW